MRAPSIPIAATLSISLVLALQGCASTKEDIFPKNMRPMSEVYDRHFSRLRNRPVRDPDVRDVGQPLPVDLHELRQRRVRRRDPAARQGRAQDLPGHRAELQQ